MTNRGGAAVSILKGRVLLAKVTRDLGIAQGGCTERGATAPVPLSRGYEETRADSGGIGSSGQGE